ncbi:hypothetical protein niasHT_031243 [Heterodera trifolii]|uniref:Uncharacterized protein n=1 Tax=Heterodera trifolii TaxID=157864 RepID=A0ABD2ICH5_9BILA
MAPGGKTYARLKNASKPIGSSSEDEEDELPSRKKMPLPTMKAPMYTKKPAVKVIFEQQIAAPDKTTTRPVKRNRTGMGTDTALFQQPAPQKLTTTRKSAKGNAAAPSSSSSVSVRNPPRRVRSHRDVAAQQPQQRKLEKRKAAAPQLNENCPGDHRHPSQTLLEQQNNALYRLLFDGSKENYFTHLERARHFVHTCAVCAKKYEFVLVRFPDTGVETPWHPVLPKHENLRDEKIFEEPDTIYAFDAAWQDCTAPDEAIGGNENEDGGDDENGRGNNNGGGNKKKGGQRRDGGGGQKDGGGGSKDGERRNKNREGREEEEQNDNNGKRGEREREEERREEEEEEQSGHNEERGEKKRREEGRGKDGGEEEDDGRGEEETRERGDEEETEEAREKLKRGEEKERGEKGGGGKETNGGRRSENGGKAKEGRNEGGGKAGEKKQPPPGSKMTHSQWRRVMRLNKKKGLKEGQDNAHPATIFNVL